MASYHAMFRRLPGEEEAIQTVIAMAEAYGYGNLMQVISAAWEDMLALRGDPPGSAHTCGPGRLVYEKRGFSGPIELIDAYDKLKRSHDQCSRKKKKKAKKVATK